MKQTSVTEDVTVEKLVHGGQGLAELADGRKVFVWNALPGERIRARLIKQKRSYAEAIAEEILEASPDRIEPLEENYLATSPWQIMTFEAENRHKKTIVEELFAHGKVALPAMSETVHVGPEFYYRNKMEYSFWGDEAGLHLALHQRGSQGKQIVTGSKLALPAVDTAANAIMVELQKLNPRAGDLKTVIVRANQKGGAVAALFTKLPHFREISLPEGLKGLRVYYSDPKSPASVPTKLLYELGNAALHDKLLGRPFTYDVDSFFQVNLPVFEQALGRIKSFCTTDDLVDMYAGVGSIGLSVAGKSVELIELDPATAAMARVNAAASGLDAEVIEASADDAIQSIVSDKPVIFDPPRAGLHAKIIERILEARPPRIVYLSCNPATHARDLKLLESAYKITHFEVFNFFPRTPHIETLAVLEYK